VILAQTFVAMPFLVVSLEGALRTGGERYEVIAASLGAPPWTVFRRITVPLVLPGLGSGMVLSFARCLGEVRRHHRVCRQTARGHPHPPLEVYLQREVDAAQFAPRRPRRLSGGPAQRIALGRALASEPDLLLLDEPLSAVDVEFAPALRSLLHSVLQDRLALIVTHQVIDALVPADHVVVLEGGRVVEQGLTQEVLARPRSAFVARLAGLNLIFGTATAAGLRADNGTELTGTTDSTVRLHRCWRSGSCRVQPRRGGRIHRPSQGQPTQCDPRPHHNVGTQRHPRPGPGHARTGRRDHTGRRRGTRTTHRRPGVVCGESHRDRHLPHAYLSYRRGC
jgi:ABC transporter/Binding-protein-dependent transport system inner membrane component